MKAALRLALVIFLCAGGLLSARPAHADNYPIDNAYFTGEVCVDVSAGTFSGVLTSKKTGDVYEFEGFVRAVRGGYQACAVVSVNGEELFDGCSAVRRTRYTALVDLVYRVLAALKAYEDGA